MPSFTDVGEYLEANQLEQILSDAVVDCVEDERPQPLLAIADRLYERAAALAVDWDYVKLTADVRQLIEREQCGPLFMRLAFSDAATYSAALGDGGPNAALRFVDKGEGQFTCNSGLAARAVPLLEPIKARYPCISRADLWAHAANLSIEALGGPTILTRFGRRDAASSAEAVPSAAGRLPEDLADGGEAAPSEGKAEHLRAVFGPKGFGDREIVALCGRHTVGEYVPPDGQPGGGAWTANPQRFDNSYYAELIAKKWEPAAAGAAGVLLRSEAGADGGTASAPTTIMLPTDHALLRDPRLRVHAERYASDQPSFFADFSAAWAKLIELGCGRLQPHPASLTYASSCVVPVEWFELPLLTQREHNHDTTVYGFGLPQREQRLSLPACACLLVRAPGRGRDGRDAVRAYFPTSDPGQLGRFELMVKRHTAEGAEAEGGSSSSPPDVVASWLHDLPLGARVSFKHPALCLKEQYPFDGKKQINLLAGGMGIAPMYQILWKLLFTPADDRKVRDGASRSRTARNPPPTRSAAASARLATAATRLSAPHPNPLRLHQVVLLYHSRCVGDVLLKDELDEWARALPHRLTVVHVVGDAADTPPPTGWKTTDGYVAEAGLLDKAKVGKYAFAPSKETLCFVCGPPALYSALCGPREERQLREGTALDQLGYTGGMVAKL